MSIELPNPADLACFENKASAATQLGQAMCAEGAKVIRNSPSRTSFRKIATSGTCSNSADTCICIYTVLSFVFIAHVH